MSLSESTLLDRRQWLGRAGLAGLGAAGLFAAPAGLPASVGPRVRPPVRSPGDALRMLMDGNERFATGRSDERNRSVARLRELSAGQTPFASVLACADSRVAPEIAFDQGFGDLFVARVAGNIATSEVIGSLEYAAQVLGSQLLVVLGHTACGAVSATVSGDAVPGQIGSLFPYIHPAADEVADETPGGGAPPLDAVIAENARNQVEILREASPVLRTLTREGKLMVVPGVFHFHTGRVELLDHAGAA